MRSSAAALPFVVLTILCWGNYGPLMHHGQQHMGGVALRAFIGVGFAYFLIAVLVPLGMLVVSGEKGQWTGKGALLSFLAGCAGAIGALGVILAFTFKGSPVYVMPMVFGGAPIVNTIVTMTLLKTFDRVSPKFLLAVLTAALGAAGVLTFKPAPAKKHVDLHTTVAAVESAVEKGEENGGETAESDSVAAEPVAPPAEPAAAPATANVPVVVASILAAMLCWGSYGPVLHIGQSKMGGSRMRPFLCVGIAYFVMAVALPVILMPALNIEFGDWSASEMQQGLLWSLGGGAAGALGALGIVLAFNFGGKPIFVMPLVFGLAPIFNTITTLTESGLWGEIDMKFIAALVVTIIGAVCVLIFAPKPTPPKKPTESPVDEPNAPAGTPA